MSFDPQKFSIGVVDLFSVLLPGAVLVYLARDLAPAATAFISVQDHASTESWIVFAFASYLVGHLIFLLGAQIDDGLYDPLRRASYVQQIERMADTEKRSLAHPWTRALAGWMFGKTPDAAVMRVVRIKAAALAPLLAGKAINAFQWSKARLSKDHPPGLAMVQRFEADSKFFRSFAVALVILVFIYIRKDKPEAAIFCALLVVPVLWRYIDQRFKATQQAYWLILTLEAANKDGTRFATGRAPDGPTHAGGVVSKGREGPEYLVVRPRETQDEWVLPKGHIEPGEDPRLTAVREIEEETGHWARLKTLVGDYRLGAGADAPFARIYLMELAEEKKQRDDGYREQRWITLQDAEQLARDHKLHKETLAVLRDADKRTNQKVSQR